MAILNYISATSTSPPARQDPSATPSQPIPNPRQTKIILPKQKPLNGSVTVAPGDSGGTPTISKARRWWGKDEDPLTSDEFIWNRDFMDRMKKLVEDPDSSKLSPEPSIVEELEEPGFLSLNRVMRLDSLEVDLSKELTSPSKLVLEQSIGVATQTRGTMSQKWKSVPIQGEKEKWDRASMASTGGTNAMLWEISQPKGDPEELAAQSREQYFKLKKKLQILTLGIGGAGLVSAYVSYSPEVAASFGAGLLGSLVYMRMLGNSVDAIANKKKRLMRGGIAQPRLLVPVLLVMVFNRWNEILVPQYGLLHLELIPMLVGFFTYKIATFLQAVEEAIAIVGRKTQV
ncbi:hypothetical protein SLEP1_g34501 [Rubroshorea leprosula]|uniref:CGL160/ATPI domain-containing protein n=2 Tax=Rubroshorea leprosula TaxID=152421 RepID=A0AAV5KK29_9ROSI|nr:hypothetical protein SLEP1_g34501 [Rubroshorea leprosula]